MTMTSIHISVILQLGGGFQGQQGDVTDVLGIAAGIFALVLLALSTYAWTKRRQTSLIFVSAVFLLFFFKVVLEILPSEGNTLQFVSVILDFVILALFFLAIVVRPRLKTPSTKDLENSGAVKK